MRVAHVLRKCDPSAWGGTEMAMQRMFNALAEQGISSTVYCPRLNHAPSPDPLQEAGHRVARFRAFVPIWGISPQRRRQLLSVGGNLLSFDLLPALWREPEIHVIHAHTLGRLGGIALTTAKRRRLPFVVSIHGGALDLPDALQRAFHEPAAPGWEWGKFFGLLFQSHRLFVDADAIVACNDTEAALLRNRHPGKRVVVQPHAVPLASFEQDCRQAARSAFPVLGQGPVLLCLGRIDPVKNQLWLIEQAPRLFSLRSGLKIVLAGACTDEEYGQLLNRRIQALGVEDRVFLTGGIPPNDPRLIGLLQSVAGLVLPSLSETFGLVILEAWAAGLPVVASRTSGASALIEPESNGWLFDLEDPLSFHAAIGRMLSDPAAAAATARRGREKVAREYTPAVVAGRLKSLYEQVTEARACAT